MKRLILMFAALCLLAVPARAEPRIGGAAPDFTLTDSRGTPHTLGDYKGKIVVLEWTNPGCPYVHKHYDSGTMQKLQADAIQTYGVTWLRINSSARGKEGYVDAEGAEASRLQTHSAETAYLLDPDGKVGRLYGAKTTPHMFIIDAKGIITYMGAIDDAPSADKSSLSGAKSYIRAALDDMKHGKEVDMPVTQPYGCGVKYGDDPS